MLGRKGKNNQNTLVPSSSQAELSTAVSALTETTRHSVRHSQGQKVRRKFPQHRAFGRGPPRPLPTQVCGKFACERSQLNSLLAKGFFSRLTPQLSGRERERERSCFLSVELLETIPRVTTDPRSFKVTQMPGAKLQFFTFG